ncbi:hypothetical protein Poly59_36030 [Rubripirellula reticaptiva]|uniref:Uncharacterized protein n=1 Tax=Rubripirellula reticaptiva TaxID=2528013 RepID=A0A5C6EWE1_9BACT|nr:hypothetical protein Poly59_36030 [Rubripirellula reticaptiva]
MSRNLRTWFLRFPFVCVIAASMGWIGLILMYLGSPFFPRIDDFWTRYVALASTLIWGVASYFLRNSQLRSWVIFGIASPLVGALLVAPPASFAFVLAKAYVAIPVGLATGVVMYVIVCGGNSHNHGVNRSGEVGRSFGTAGISLLLSSTDNCRMTNRVSVANAVIVCNGLWTAARSIDPRRTFPAMGRPYLEANRQTDRPSGASR